MKRPYVICHMVPSLDGRIVPTGWSLPASMSREYETTAKTFKADGWMIGRVSMAPYAGKTTVPKRRGGAKIPRTDFIARTDAPSYAIGLDPSGKLTWRSGSIDDEHVISVLTEKVSDDYLAFLRDKGVSYLFGGKTRVDLKRILEKLHRHFGIRRLLLEGGGKINGSFLAANLIDELSVLLVPVADGAIGTPTLFDMTSASTRHSRHGWKLVSVKSRANSVVWLRYKAQR